MSRRWMYTYAALLLLGIFGDYAVWAVWSSDWQAIGRVLAGISAIGMTWALLVESASDDTDEPDEPSRTAYLRRPDHERASR